MVVHRHGKHALGMNLADHIVIQHLADFARGRNPVRGFQPRGFGFLADDVHAKLDAFVADEHGRTRNQLAHLVLAFAAERAIKSILAVTARVVRHRNLCHLSYRADGPNAPDQKA